jgi:nitrogen fixation NifU-like protein
MQGVLWKMSEINELYSDIILDLWKYPLHKRELEGECLQGEDTNSFCGDSIKIFVKVDNGKIIDVGFKGEGCAISQASASLLLENIKGKDINDILKININDLVEDLGVPELNKNATRIKCAALSLKVLKNILYNHLVKND